METTMEAPVKFTLGAIAEINRLLQQDQSVNGKFLRVGVRGGGCSGMTYVLNFSEKEVLDIEYETNGIRFIMDPTHELYLYGMEVDFEGGLNSRGFTFSNPNASKTCGCGTSFSV